MGEELTNERVAFLMANEGVEQIELTRPLEALRAAGAEAELIAPGRARSGPSSIWTRRTPSRGPHRSRMPIPGGTAEWSGRGRAPVGRRGAAASRAGNPRGREWCPSLRRRRCGRRRRRSHDRRPVHLAAMGDRERDRPRRDDTATEHVEFEGEGQDTGDSGNGHGPYGNPSLDEEALRKSQEERSSRRGRGREPV
jgi:hypothetical protein